MFYESGHDPSKLKKTGGRSAEYTSDSLLKFLKENPGATATIWKDAVLDDTGMSKSKFYKFKKALETAGKVVSRGGKFFVTEIEVGLPDGSEI